MADAHTPAHRPPPPGHRPAPNSIGASLEALAAITAAWDSTQGGTQPSSRPPSASARPALTTPSAPRAPASARRFVYVRSPRQSYITQKASGDHNRPGREMGVSQVKLPYSTPWYRPQLEETVEELERAKLELKKLREVLKSVTKERDDAYVASRRSAQILTERNEEARELHARIEEQEEELKRERFATEFERREKDVVLTENAKLTSRVQMLHTQLEDTKEMMADYLQERVQAERSSADAAVTVAKAEAAAEIANSRAEQISKERDDARRAAAMAAEADQSRDEEARLEAERREAERRARLENRIIHVREDTREYIDQQIRLATAAAQGSTLNDANGGQFGIVGAGDYSDPSKPIWDMLESKQYASMHASPIVLLSAAWLRTARPSRLPARHELPPEAIIPVRSLRAIASTIEKGMAKNMSKPLPIIAVLHPRSCLTGRPAKHPDPNGVHLELVIRTLDARWAEFTRRRGGNQSTGVTDLGVFIDWACLHVEELDEGSGRARRSRNDHEEAVFKDAVPKVPTLYAHTLTTVWMIPEGSPPLASSISPAETLSRYREQWPCYLRLLSTLIKPSNLCDTNAWPQLLELGVDEWGTVLSRAAQERVVRAPPPEPLAFAKGHRLGGLEVPSELAQSQYPKVLYQILCRVEELDYRRCNFGDEDASWLAVLLPLCARLKRLLLSGNMIADIGAIALANALSSPSLSSLELLALDNNDIGDGGASALFQRMSPNEYDQVILRELKTFSLSNNGLNDASVMALSGAVMGGALKGCKKVALDGNPASKPSVKAVKKALKKNAKASKPPEKK